LKTLAIVMKKTSRNRKKKSNRAGERPRGEKSRGMVRAFELLAGLPAGFLSPREDGLPQKRAGNRARLT
jgi:hypothetical protein